MLLAYREAHSQPSAVMNIPATHGLVQSGSPQRDSLPATNSAAASAILPLDPATPRVLFWAFAVVLVSTLSLVAAIPFVRMPLAKIPAFIPSYESAMAICDLVTAVLLFGRVTRRRSLGFLALSCGYLFSCIIIVLHALSFPGAFSDTGLLGSNDQTTVWLYVFWHAGFPLFVLGYALLPDRDSESQYLHKHTAIALRSVASALLPSWLYRCCLLPANLVSCLD
jgi:two-component system, sensor histidine kinase and response regulator